MTRYLITLALAIAAALLTPYAKAEKVIVYREGELVNPQDVADVLGKTRSIRLLDDARAAPAKPTTTAAVSLGNTKAGSSAVARRNAKADASALSLPVRFAFGSADILPDARVQLDALAEGIKLLAPGSIVTVEGHTDAVGSDAYNLELSRVRAQAVRGYLVECHGIDAARLKTVAYGEGRPIEGTRSERRPEPPRAVPRLLNARSRIPGAVPWPRHHGRAAPLCRRGTEPTMDAIASGGLHPVWNTASLASPVRSIPSSRRALLARMSRRRLLACLALMPVLWSEVCHAQPQPKVQTPKQRRVALVIGNGRYPEIPLNNPEHDARLVAQTLRSLDFEVGEHLNLTARDFKRVLREFARQMDDDQVASVFYYAGHGVQIGGRNYLLPVDIALRDQAEVRDEAIDMQDALLAHVDRVRPRARIFIIDACRNNPFAARGRAPRDANGLAEMAAPGALIAFSAAPGGVAEDGPVGGNSIYTRHLVTELRTAGIEVEEMMKAVRIKVLRDTAQRQIPWVNTSMVVNFMFNPGAAPQAGRAETQPAVAPASAAQLEHRCAQRVGLIGAAGLCAARCERIREGEFRQPLRR